MEFKVIVDSRYMKICGQEDIYNIYEIDKEEFDALDCLYINELPRIKQIICKSQSLHVGYNQLFYVVYEDRYMFILENTSSIFSVVYKKSFEYLVVYQDENLKFIDNL